MAQRILFRVRQQVQRDDNRDGVILEYIFWLLQICNHFATMESVYELPRNKTCTNGADVNSDRILIIHHKLGARQERMR